MASKNISVAKMKPVASHKKRVTFVAPDEVTVNARTDRRTRKTDKPPRRRKPFMITEGMASDGGAADSAKAAQLISREMNQGSVLTENGKASINTILNPCGEHGAGSRFVDGTLSQSGILAFRSFETFNVPGGNTSTTPNSTNNWSLTIISPAAFKTIAILIASTINAQPTTVELNNVFSEINSSVPTQWPTWDPVGASTTLFYCIYSFPSAELAIDPNTGISGNIESMRLVGDGIEVMHNTPTLWDQGSFAVGQFKQDQTIIDNVPTQSVATLTLTVSASAVATITYGGTVGAGILAPSAPLSGSGSPPMVGFGISPLFTLRTSTGAIWADYIGTALPIVTTTTGTFPNLRYNLSVGTGPSILIQSNGFGAYTYDFALSGPIVITTGNNQPSVVMTMPSLTQTSIAQADPKFSAEIMKKHQGFYSVRRYFEPVLLMKNSAEGGNIRIENTGMDRAVVSAETGGIRGDLLDINGAVIVAVIRGISWAAAPTIKAVRYVEFMPGPNSAYAPFVDDTPAKDEDAVEIFRQVQLAGPHSYVPDANALGFLAGYLMTIVEALPLIMRGARSVSKAVIAAVDWADSNIFSKLPM
jgi:hypothetical protein